ncbi:MAG: hypothetical protein ACPG7F_04860 [Aggregatilineales bacterium]
MKDNTQKPKVVTVQDKADIQFASIETLLEMYKSEDVAKKFLAALELGRRGWSLSRDNDWIAPKR